MRRQKSLHDFVVVHHKCGDSPSEFGSCRSVEDLGIDGCAASTQYSCAQCTVYSISYIVYRIWYMVYGIRYMVYGIWYMVYGISYMVYGIWYMEYGIWYMVYGIWYMVYGIWYIVHRISYTLCTVHGSTVFVKDNDT